MGNEHMNTYTPELDHDLDRFYGELTDLEVIALADRIMVFQNINEIKCDPDQNVSLIHYAERMILRVMMLYYWEMKRSCRIQEVLENICNKLLTLDNDEGNMFEEIAKLIEEGRGDYQTGYLKTERFYLTLVIRSEVDRSEDLMSADLLRALNEYLLSERFIPLVSKHAERVIFHYRDEEKEKEKEEKNTVSNSPAVHCFEVAREEDTVTFSAKPRKGGV